MTQLCLVFAWYIYLSILSLSPFPYLYISGGLFYKALIYLLPTTCSLSTIVESNKYLLSIVLDPGDIMVWSKGLISCIVLM